MKNRKLRNAIICSALFASLIVISCRNGGSNEQGGDAASEANGYNSGGDTSNEDIGAGGAAGAEAGKAPQQTSGSAQGTEPAPATGSTTQTDTMTTTNNGNRTAKGSGLK